jgi:F-type H+-transporting ATPase subunit b
MKARLATAAAIALFLHPALGYCSPAEEQQGSWLSLLFYAINFGVFVFILSRYAIPAARDFFNSRADEIRETLRTKQANLEKAQKLADEWAARIAQLESEKAQLAKEMKDETAREVARTLELARKRAEWIRHDAELTVQAIWEAGKNQIRANLAHRAASIARDMIARNFDRGDQQRLLDEFVGRLQAETHS